MPSNQSALAFLENASGFIICSVKLLTSGLRILTEKALDFITPYKVFFGYKSVVLVS